MSDANVWMMLSDLLCAALLSIRSLFSDIDCPSYFFLNNLLPFYLHRCERICVHPAAHPLAQLASVQATGEALPVPKGLQICSLGSVRVECRLSSMPRLSWLYDHRVGGRVLLPGACVSLCATYCIALLTPFNTAHAASSQTQ